MSIIRVGVLFFLTSWVFSLNVAQATDCSVETFKSAVLGNKVKTVKAMVNGCPIDIDVPLDKHNRTALLVAIQERFHELIHFNVGRRC